MFWSCSREIFAPFFYFLHLSITIALTVFASLSLKMLYFPEAANSVKNCSFLFEISLIRRVDTVSRLALLVEFNLRSSLECSFSLAKNAEYYWLIALVPFLISSLSRSKRLASCFFDESSPRRSLAVGFYSSTRGLIGLLSTISTKA